jgi:hypothetical protein
MYQVVLTCLPVQQSTYSSQVIKCQSEHRYLDSHPELDEGSQLHGLPANRRNAVLPQSPMPSVHMGLNIVDFHELVKNIGYKCRRKAFNLDFVKALARWRASNLPALNLIRVFGRGRLT